jgi:hypothetical protein
MASETDIGKLHFTYELPTSDSLQQGDLIRRSPGVEDILSQVHPHFSAEKYRFFVVLTQSCDLVLRTDHQSKARYISIAPVRSINDVAKKVVSAVHYNELEKRLQFAPEERKGKIIQTLERIFNNNEAPYFYFYQEPALGLYEDYCAILSLSIAVKSELHYSTLHNARVLSLSSSFQHKLGYLVGTMYSKVGTQDWDYDLTDRASKLIDRTNSVTWMPKEIYQLVSKSLKDKESATPEDLVTAVSDAKKSKTTKRETVIQTVVEILSSLKVDTSVIATYERRIRSDPKIKAILGA